MDLEELNEEYKYFTNRLKMMTKEAKELAEKAETLADDKILAQAKVVMAKRDGDKDAEKAALEEIERIEKEIVEAREGAEKRKEKTKYLQNKVDEKLKDIRKDPEARKIINKAIEERYKDKLENLNKDKEELLEEKRKAKEKADKKTEFITNIQEILAQNPDLAEALESTMEVRSRMEKLIEESNQTGLDPIRAIKINEKLIPEEKKNLENNLIIMKTIVFNKRIKIDLKQLLNLFNDAEKDEEGNIKVNETLEKRKQEAEEKAKRQLRRQEKRIDRKIAKIDKDIERYRSIVEFDKDNNDEHDNNNNGKKDNNNRNNNQRGNGQENGEQSNSPLIKINWWRNFKNWFAQKIGRTTPAPTPTTNQNQDQENSNVDPVQSAREEQKMFQESLRYEIVKDAITKEAVERVEIINGNREDRNDEGDR